MEQRPKTANRYKGTLSDVLQDAKQRINSSSATINIIDAQRLVQQREHFLR